MEKYFITAIGTDSGKTICSAILCEALQADYWKPVQAGLPRDSDTVRSLITNSKTAIHHEQYLLNTPASPHAAAKIDGVTIDVGKFQLPQTENTLIIEGAGGCLVPLNDHDFVIDIIKALDANIILVADLYLGSINHTLLTVEAIKKRKLPVKGIIFNGDENPESQRIIQLHTQLDVLLHVRKEETMNKKTVSQYADQLRLKWK